MIANIVDINAVLMSFKHETLLCSCVWSLKVIKSNETISAHTHSITQTHSKVILLLSCNPINWILHFSFVLQQLDQEFIIKIKINLLSRPSHYHSRSATFTSFAAFQSWYRMYLFNSNKSAYQLLHSEYKNILHFSFVLKQYDQDYIRR